MAFPYKSFSCALLLVFVATEVGPMVVAADEGCPAPGTCLEPTSGDLTCQGPQGLPERCNELCTARQFVGGKCENRKCYCNSNTVEAPCWEILEYLCTAKGCTTFCEQKKYAGGFCRNNTCMCQYDAPSCGPQVEASYGSCQLGGCYEPRPYPSCEGVVDGTEAKCQSDCRERTFERSKCDAGLCYCDSNTYKPGAAACWELVRYVCEVDACRAYCTTSGAVGNKYEDGICRNNLCMCKKKVC